MSGSDFPRPEKVRQVPLEDLFKGSSLDTNADLKAKNFSIGGTTLFSEIRVIGSLPWTEEEYYAIADEFRPLTIPDLFLIVEENGKPIAHSFSWPDYGPILSGMRRPFAFIKWMRFKKLSHSIDRMRCLSFQIHRDYHGRGIETFLYMKMMSTAKKLGYRQCIILALENYPINRQIRELDGNVEKRLRIYQYPVKTPSQTE